MGKRARICRAILTTYKGAIVENWSNKEVYIYQIKSDSTPMKPAKELNLIYIGSTLFICKLKKYHRSDE